LAAPVEAELIVLRRDGVAANPLTITVKPRAILEEALPEAVMPGPAVPEEIAPPAVEPNGPQG